jgi:hypothetical protein
VFKANVKFIDSLNAEKCKFWLGINQFADLTNGEFRATKTNTRGSNQVRSRFLLDLGMKNLALMRFLRAWTGGLRVQSLPSRIRANVASIFSITHICKHIFIGDAIVSCDMPDNGTCFE